MKTTSSVTIRRPAASVFAYLRDPERMKLWLTDFLEASAPLDGPAGTELSMTFRQMGGGTRVAATTILTVEANRKLVYRMSDPSFDVVVEFELVADGDDTKLTQILAATGRNETMIAMAKQFESMAAQQHQRDLERLQALAEAG